MSSDCDESCDGQWLTKCLDLLDKNNIVLCGITFLMHCFNLINFGRIN